VTSGFAAVLKPPGVGSQTLLHRLRRAWRLPDLGHAGTLDPLAAGVMVVAAGFARRLIDVAAWDKAYEAEVLLGLATDSGDLDGRVVSTVGAEGVTAEAVAEVLPRLTGRIQQVPPALSAVKIEGRPSYAWARSGRPVSPKPRWVTVHAIELVAFEAGPVARTRLRLTTSTGTYVRAIARDLGEALGVGGCLGALVRTRVGPFRAEAASAPWDPPAWVPPQAALDLPVVELDPAAARRVQSGQPIPCPPGCGEWALGVADGAAVALLAAADGRLWPRRVRST
jgi:tRNA pseudouridine55 synthase